MASNLVDDDTKQKIATALKNQERLDSIECGKPDIPRVYNDSQLSDFVNKECWLFFKLCNVEPEFLTLPVNEWQQNHSFKKFLSLVKSFSPLNDAGERAVKLGSDFYGYLS